MDAAITTSFVAGISFLPLISCQVSDFTTIICYSDNLISGQMSFIDDSGMNFTGSDLEANDSNVTNRTIFVNLAILMVIKTC